MRGTRAIAGRVGIAVASIMLAACAGGSGAAPEPVEGRSFHATAVVGIDWPSGRPMQLVFYDNGWTSIVGLCNEFGNDTVWSGNELVMPEVGATAAGCPAEQQVYDDWVVEVLRSRPAFVLDGDTMTVMTSVDGVDVEIEFLDSELLALGPDGAPLGPPATPPPPTEPPTTAPPATAPPATAPPTTSPDPTGVPDPDEAASPASTTPAAGDPECLDGLTTTDRAALLAWPAMSPSQWEPAVVAVRTHGVGGVLLMEPTGWDREDLVARLDALRSMSSHGLLVATDEEGGIVQRLRDVVGPLSSQQEVSETMDPASAEALIAVHGRLVREVGVDVVLGPVADVVPPTGEPPLTRSRFFTGDPDLVAEYTAAYVRGWEASGLTPVVKHFPGHGGASGDTHDGAGRTAPLDELEQWDLIPFGATVAPGSAVMVGHLTVPGLTGDLPATLSPAAIAYLRDNIGLDDGLVVSDALGMSAIALSEPDAAVASIGAGVDVVLFTETAATPDVIDAIVAAVDAGELPAGRVDDAARKVMVELGACPS